MNLWQELRCLDKRLSGSPLPGESRRDYFARMSKRWSTGYIPRSLYLELVDVYDRVGDLERRLNDCLAREAAAVTRLPAGEQRTLPGSPPQS